FYDVPEGLKPDSTIQIPSCLKKEISDKETEVNTARTALYDRILRILKSGRKNELLNMLREVEVREDGTIPASPALGSWFAPSSTDITPPNLFDEIYRTASNKFAARLIRKSLHIQQIINLIKEIKTSSSISE